MATTRSRQYDRASEDVEMHETRIAKPRSEIRSHGRTNGSDRLWKMAIAVTLVLCALSFMFLVSRLLKIVPNIQNSSNLIPNSRSNTETINQKRPPSSTSTEKSDDESNGKHLTAILPMIMKDFERFRLFMKTFKKFFKIDDLHSFLVIGKDSEKEDMTKELNKLAVEKGFGEGFFTFIPDYDIVPELKDHGDTIGWMQQQILKLAAARIIKTDFYLILDSDLITVRPVGESELLSKFPVHPLMGINSEKLTVTADKVNKYGASAGPLDPLRAMTNMEPRKFPKSHRIDWFEGSEAFLEMKIPEAANWVFGVTPAIFSTRIARGLLDRIEELGKPHGKNWREWFFDNIFRHTFTEYGLYYTFATASGQFMRDHVPVENGIFQHFNSIWWKDQFRDLDKLLKDATNQNRPFEGAFIVIQSNTGVPVFEYLDTVNKYIDAVKV